MMDLILKGDMRSQDWSCERDFDLEQQDYCDSTNGQPSATATATIRNPGSVMISSIRRGFRMKRRKGSPNSRLSTQTDRPGKESGGSRKKVIDPQPQGPFRQLWNNIFAVSCTIALPLDPLFFYVFVVDNNRKCIDLDNKLKIIACVLRSLTDLFYIFHMLLQFRTGYIALSSKEFGRGEMIEDLWAIAKRYLFSYLTDIFLVLPLPQVVILFIAPRVIAQGFWFTRALLVIAISSQFALRYYKIALLYMETMRHSGTFPETPRAGAAFYLFLCMLASNILGAFWYLFTIERLDACWRISCAEYHCNSDALYCGVPRAGDYSFLNSSCPLLEPNEIKQAADFNFGIFLEALQSGVVEKETFWRKFFYCFWWGLRNLSSLGQNLRTSYFIGENLFAISISIFALVLFALLIHNLQNYVETLRVRKEELRAKRQDRKKIEQWMSHRMLPVNLRHKIRRYEQYKWQETRGIQEDSLIKNLPKDLRRDINHHLCRALLTRVPMFAKMDHQLVDALCDRLKPVFYTENSCIYRKGDPVDEMLFLTRGNLLSMTTNGGETGFSVVLKPGDFCGEELIPWALDPNSRSSLPTSTRIIEAMKDVEAFALRADDLRFVASQFRHLHSKQIQHIFRYYSQQWRTWAACFIQEAWHRYRRKKLEKSLREEEDRLLVALAEGENSTSLVSTIYASRFAANALRALGRNHPHDA